MSGILKTFRHELGRIFALKAIFSTLFVAALIGLVLSAAIGLIERLTLPS